MRIVWCVFKCTIKSVRFSLKNENMKRKIYYWYKNFIMTWCNHNFIREVYKEDTATGKKIHKRIVCCKCDLIDKRFPIETIG